MPHIHLPCGLPAASPSNPRMGIARPVACRPWERGPLARRRAGRPRSQALGRRCPAAMQSSEKALRSAPCNALQRFLKRGLGVIPLSVRTFIAPAVGGASSSKALGKDSAFALGKAIGKAMRFDAGVSGATTADPPLGGPPRPSA